MQNGGTPVRLFIAINFDEEIITTLNRAVQRLKDASAAGNFTRAENLHLTLVFIGETRDVPAVKEAMMQVHGLPFDLKIKGLGKFGRGGKDIYWLGVDRCAELSEIQKTLSEALCEKGFAIEQREYRPHLTLGREVVLLENFDKIAFEKAFGTITQEVKTIDLMKSDRIGGRLTYTKIFSVPLG